MSDTDLSKISDSLTLREESSAVNNFVATSNQSVS